MKLRWDLMGFNNFPLTLSVEFQCQKKIGIHVEPFVVFVCRYSGRRTVEYDCVRTGPFKHLTHRSKIAEALTVSFWRKTKVPEFRGHHALERFIRLVRFR